MAGEVMNFASIFGRGFPGSGGRGADEAVAEASGPASGSKSPALFWVALVAMLVLARIIYERAE